MTHSGYILCNSTNITVNLAMSLAGISEKLVVATPDLVPFMESMGIPLAFDLQGADPIVRWR